MGELFERGEADMEGNGHQASESEVIAQSLVKGEAGQSELIEVAVVESIPGVAETGSGPKPGPQPKASSNQEGSDETLGSEQEPSPLEFADLVANGVRLAVGAIGLMLAAVADVLGQLVPGPEAAPAAGWGSEGAAGSGPEALAGSGPDAPAEADSGPAPLEILRLLPGAALGLGFQAGRRLAGTGRSINARVGPAASFVARRSILRRPMEALRHGLDAWDRLGGQERRDSERAARQLARAVIPQLVTAFLDQIDLDDIMARVDLDPIVRRLDFERIIKEQVDVNAIADGLDIGRILDRVDFNAIIAQRVDMESIVDRLDFDRIVDRLDLDGIVARVNVNSVVERVDLPGITKQVMDEIDMGEIIHQSTSSITTETIDALRSQGVNADRILSRVVDRLLLRKGERQTRLPAGDGS